MPPPVGGSRGRGHGKDWISGYIGLSFFKWPQVYFPPSYVAEVERNRAAVGEDPHTRRVVTTSVRDDHLDILWAEISRWLRTCRVDLREGEDGLFMTHHELRFKREAQAKNPVNYLKGLVVGPRAEGLAGHHAAYTLAVGDEASGLDDEADNQMRRWAKRLLYFGNPNPCQNFWRTNYQQGDLLA